MDHLILYNEISIQISRLITKYYSTSFSSATSLLDKEMRNAIFSIYGFVRLADEIVDTFHDQDKKSLLEKFELDFYDALQKGISLNPVLHSFQRTVRKYSIPDDHIQAFLKSMKNDIFRNQYKTKSSLNEYIYGSADVVGLMCLRVFCRGDSKLYNDLEKFAMKLGSAFQKINFLRDLKNDIENLDRSYFPEIKNGNFDEITKLTIVNDIENDFKIAYQGIKRLPGRAKLAVLLAYYYYRSLLKKLKKIEAREIIKTRIRISNFRKILLLLKSLIVYKFI